MTTRPRLYPSHQHQWTEHRPGNWWPHPHPTQVICTICGFTSPRSLANLDGAMLDDAVYDEAEADVPATDKGAAT